MAASVHDFVHYFIIIVGLFLNVSTIFLILHMSAKRLKEYSLLILNTSVIELSSIIAKLLVHCRLLIYSHTSISISEGPCYSISDSLCSIAIGFMHVNMMHSNTVISLSFWYRARILREGAVLGRFRLQSLILILFLPHIFHIVVAWTFASPREELVPIVDRVYGSNSTNTFGLFGYTDFTKFSTLLITAYLCIIPLFHNMYIVYARRKLIAMFAEKMKTMSAKTREIHKSFAMVLTITALSSAVVAPLFMSIGALKQVLFNIHSPFIEGIIYNGAVLPAIVNPALTLYFVGSYRAVLSYFSRLSLRISISPLTNSSSFTA